MLLVGFSIQAQKPQKDIEKQVKIYCGYVKDKNIDSVLSFMYPLFFESFPKAPLRENMKTVFNDTTIRLSFGDVAVQNISPVFEHDTVKYVMVGYTMQMLVDVSKNPGMVTGTAMDMLKGNYESFYGAENVKMDKEKGLFTVSAKNNMFAIQNPRYGNRWWLIEKPKTPVGFEKVIPDAVWKHFAN